MHHFNLTVFFVLIYFYLNGHYYAIIIITFYLYTSQKTYSVKSNHDLSVNI